MMITRKFTFTFGDRKVELEAEQEGNCRYMVRMQEGDKGRVRIGYLTGSNRHWVAEFYGGRQSKPYASAKAACLALADWALTQPAFARPAKAAA